MKDRTIDEPATPRKFYLKGVEDPISSATCGASDNSNGYGMSQLGAYRWSRGNQCAIGGSASTGWPVTWSDYRQILVHYYTGINIVGSNTPDDRWNLLSHNNFGSPTTPALVSGQPASLQIRLQNTSTTTWNANGANEIEIDYHWGDNNWQTASVSPSFSEIAAGKEFPDITAPLLTVSNIIPPAVTGTESRILHIDIKRNGVRLSSAGWPDAQIAVNVTGAIATPTPVPGSRGYVNGIHVKYYNDSPPVDPITLDGPINWNTFTPPVVYEEDVPTIHFTWGTTSPAPGVNSVFWSASYEGILLVPQDGTYTFYLDYLDDGGRLYVDGNMLIDKWLVQGPHFYNASIPLTAGQHPIKIEYAQGPGNEGSLSVAWELPGVFAKELIGPASMATSTPGPSPTAISGTPITPPPTAVSVTPIPPTPIATTPAPPPPCILQFAANMAALQTLSTDPYYSTPTPSASTLKLLSQPDPVELASLIYRIRDEVMSNTSVGKQLTSLYYDHSAEIAALMLSDEKLYNQGFATLDLFTPGLQALADGKGVTATITAEQVDAVQVFLDELTTRGSPKLQQAIQKERERRPLEAMIGMSMDQAWRYVNGYRLKWLPPIGTEDSYTGQQGRVIPVKFTVTDFEGNFVMDETLILQVLDSNGNVVIGPVQVSDNTNNNLKIQGNQYHYNLQTKDLPAGSYTLQITYNSSNGVQSETRSIILTRRK